MNNEPKPGMGFLPTVSSKGRIEIIPNAPPAPIVNNYNFYIDPKAMTALRDAAFMVLMIVVVFVAIGYGPKLLRA
jgi:hypothetical protein